jgi:hypothetical protein
MVGPGLSVIYQTFIAADLSFSQGQDRPAPVVPVRLQISIAA